MLVSIFEAVMVGLLIPVALALLCCFVTLFIVLFVVGFLFDVFKFLTISCLIIIKGLW